MYGVFSHKHIYLLHVQNNIFVTSYNWQISIFQIYISSFIEIPIFTGYVKFVSIFRADFHRYMKTFFGSYLQGLGEN